MDVPEPDEEDANARAIVAAVHRGDLEEVRRLVEQDRGLLDANNGSSTPLRAAAWGFSVEVMRYLLDEGADANLQSPIGCSALDVACIRGHLGMASLLLAHGADAAAVWGEGETPLMRACAYGHADIVALLLAHGCGDISRQRGLGGSTALHYACVDEHVRIVRALLGAGADPHAVDPNGETPLARAVRLGHEECVAVLQVRSVVIVAEFPNHPRETHRPLQRRWGSVNLHSSPSRQEWECLYLLCKARRLRDAAATTLRHRQASGTIAVASSQAPAYVASRVEAGELLPEVEVEGVQEEGAQKRGGVDEGLLVREAVVGHVVEGLRGELVRELVGMLDV
jgi:hypothetical protein